MNHQTYIVVEATLAENDNKLWTTNCWLNFIDILISQEQCSKSRWRKCNVSITYKIGYCFNYNYHTQLFEWQQFIIFDKYEATIKSIQAIHSKLKLVLILLRQIHLSTLYSPKLPIIPIKEMKWMSIIHTCIIVCYINMHMSMHACISNQLSFTTIT